MNTVTIFTSDLFQYKSTSKNDDLLKEDRITSAKQIEKMSNRYKNTHSLLMIYFSGSQAFLQGGGSYIGRVWAEMRAPVTPAITNGSPRNPSFASPALQSKGTVSTHVKLRMEQEGHSGRKKEGGKGPAYYLHTPVILIYTGCQPLRSKFILVAGATGLFSPSLAR